MHDGDKIPRYIFISPDGHTFSPSSDSPVPDIENMQVLGFSAGRNEREALNQLYRENPHLEGKGYERVIGVEVRGEWVRL